MTDLTEFILASASPRRAELCRLVDLRFRQVSPDVDEAYFVDSPNETARENARRKISWVRVHHPGMVSIAADTVVSLDERCIGKPSSPAEAKEFLKRFSGCEHKVITATAISHPQHDPLIVEDISFVRFKALSDGEISDYLSKVDPMDKAGGYDIGDHGDLLVSSYKGSYTNIMGLPMERLFTILWRPSE
jgi:septum formation protein